jgi:hypothetical protein
LAHDDWPDKKTGNLSPRPLPPDGEELLYGTTSAIWLILTTIYLLRRLRRKGAFRADLRHHMAGPLCRHCLHKFIPPFQARKMRACNGESSSMGPSVV